MTEQTVKCPICGKPYVFHPMYVGDQSACPKCRQKARKSQKWDTPPEPNKPAPTLRREKWIV